MLYHEDQNSVSDYISLKPKPVAMETITWMLGKWYLSEVFLLSVQIAFEKHIVLCAEAKASDTI